MISQVEILGLECVERLAHRIHRGRDRLRALLVGRQVLGAAVIGLQAAKFEVRRIGDAAREAAAAFPGMTPQRSMPTSISTRAPS